jgi:hypothetical protein
LDCTPISTTFAVRSSLALAWSHSSGNRIYTSS